MGSLAPTLAVVLTAALGGGCRASESMPEKTIKAVPLPTRITGANIRAVGDRRRGYGTPKSRETLARLSKLGVNTVAVLLEGRMSSLTDTKVRPPSAQVLADTRAVLCDANAMGLATVLIPHLYLDDGKWRGHIAFSDAKQRDAWWDGYGAFIEDAAGLAAETGVDLFSVGVELKGMSHEIDTRTRMRNLVERLKKTYRGKLTYSANWDEAERVAFWDIVDLVGVNAYYPLVPDPERGAAAVGRRMRKLAFAADRDVLVLEVGYRSSPSSHVRPWEWPEDLADVAVDDAAQARAWAAILTHWLDTPKIRGIVLWVVPTDPDDPASEPRHGFNPLNKPAETVIKRGFQRGRSPAP